MRELVAVAARLACLTLAGVLIAAVRPARMEVPPSLTSVSPLEVSGSNPRRWGKPLAIGPYRSLEVRDGTEFSWSVPLFGVQAGKASRKYRLSLEAPDGTVWQVDCRTRSIEAWHKGWSVELTDAFQPRLACGLAQTGADEPARLVLTSDGRKLRGAIEGGPSVDLEIESVHRFEGSRLPVAAPVGFLLKVGGEAVAAVETINRGRVWIAPRVADDPAAVIAAASAALLLFDPEIGPED